MTDNEIKSLFDSLREELVALGISIEQSKSGLDSYNASTKTLYATSPFTMDKKNRYLFSEAIVTEQTKNQDLSPMELGAKVREYILPDDKGQFYACYKKHITDEIIDAKKYEKTSIIDVSAMAEELFVSPMMVKHRGIDLGLLDTN